METIAYSIQLSINNQIQVDYSQIQSKIKVLGQIIHIQF